MANDKPDATWHPLPDPNKTLDEIWTVVKNRMGDPAIANSIAMTHIVNLLNQSGRPT